MKLGWKLIPSMRDVTSMAVPIRAECAESYNNRFRVLTMINKDGDTGYYQRVAVLADSSAKTAASGRQRPLN